MITVTVNQKDLLKTERLITNLPKNTEQALKDDTTMFAKMIQKGAKLRAPRWTGKLAESIEVRKSPRGALVEVGMPYGYYQEFGFRPHAVQLFRPTGSGHVVADWAADKGIPGYKNSIFVSKNKPFIKPAVDRVVQKIPDLLNKSIAQAIRKS